jgi:hypothetical protein
VVPLSRYIANQSLFGDEAALVVNVVGRRFGELHGPLTYHQAAPYGFLLVVKAVQLLLGLSEYALRLVPLTTGVAPLALFYQLARRVLDACPALGALVSFSVCWELVNHSSMRSHARPISAAATAMPRAFQCASSSQ